MRDDERRIDVAFLDAELRRAGRTVVMSELCRVLDTRVLAREMHPGQRNNLDALCKRYGIDKQFEGIVDVERLGIARESQMPVAALEGEAALDEFCDIRDIMPIHLLEGPAQQAQFLTIIRNLPVGDEDALGFWAVQIELDLDAFMWPT